MGDPRDYFQNQLDLLEHLLPSASPSERDYYNALKTQYTAMLTQNTASADAPEDLARRRRDRAWRYVAQLERELKQPELGEYWHRWILEELPQARTRLEHLHNSYCALVAEPQGPPESDPALELLNARNELAAQQVEEIEALIGLRRSWLERQSRPINPPDQRTLELEGRLTHARAELKRVEDVRR
ncbi:hypothetical protein DESA109040_07430 [Deinococcus saxicola]|uniref:hypothetical protein n=1 Tax=Deinococcus saxicola TaxID=249406 RepID=UPI0039EFFDF3